MRVYHGSYCIVDKPDISFSRDSLDFGKGFYVTNIEKQAISWTDRFKKRGKKGYINIYELKLEKRKEKFKVKEFLVYNIEWLDFILDCRDGKDGYLNYDIIIGGIADDRVYNTIELYRDNLIEKEEALRRLQYFKPNNQICIINQKIIEKYLKYEGSKEV